MGKHQSSVRVKGLKGEGFEGGRYDAALLGYDKSADDDRVSAYCVAVRSNHRGRQLMERGCYAEAIACFLRVLEHNCGDADVYESIAESYAELGRHVEAIPYYARAIELDPVRLSAHHNKGLAHSSTGDYAGAVVCYSRAIEVSPDYAQSHYSLGVAYVHLGDYASSISCFARAIELDVTCGEAYYHKGYSHAALGEYAEAIVCYERSLSYRPKADACHGLGLVYSKLGESEKALSSYERGLKLPGDHKVIWRNMGAAYYAMGDEAKAYECCIQSARLGHVEVQRHLEEDGIDWRSVDVVETRGVCLQGK
jgi:tetratricopeptide (TPR) repeat protein